MLTPIEDKVRPAFPGIVGTLRHASMRGMIGTGRAGLATQSSDWVEAESNLPEAQSTVEQNRGPKDNEMREWTLALANFYVAWNEAERGKGYDAKAVEWKSKVDANK